MPMQSSESPLTVLEAPPSGDSPEPSRFGELRNEVIVTEGLTKVYYPEASAVVIFLVMAIVLLVRPAGILGRTVAEKV